MGAETTIHESQGVRILEFPATGSPLGNSAASLEMIAAARGQRAEWIAVPMERLGDEFFRPRSGVAGEVLQKFVTYQLRIAIVGNIASLSSGSKALDDLVVECNRGSKTWFVRDLEELKERLRQRPH